jgi:hypothetical protein
MLLLKNPVVLSIIASLVVYAIIYRSTVEETDSFVGYDQSSLVYAVFVGAFVYVGVNSLTKATTTTTAAAAATVGADTRIINGENVMVAPYSST